MAWQKIHEETILSSRALEQTGAVPVELGFSSSLSIANLKPHDVTSQATREQVD